MNPFSILWRLSHPSLSRPSLTPQSMKVAVSHPCRAGPGRGYTPTLRSRSNAGPFDTGPSVQAMEIGTAYTFSAVKYKTCSKGCGRVGERVRKMWEEAESGRHAVEYRKWNKFLQIHAFPVFHRIFSAFFMFWYTSRISCIFHMFPTPR